MRKNLILKDMDIENKKIEDLHKTKEWGNWKKAHTDNNKAFDHFDMNPIRENWEKAEKARKNARDAFNILEQTKEWKEARKV